MVGISGLSDASGSHDVWNTSALINFDPILQSLHAE